MTEEREENAPSGDPEIDRGVADLDHKGDKLEDAIRETKREWEGKQGDQSVPGATSEDEHEDEEQPGGDEEDVGDDDSEAEAADRAGQ
jgi:hypothetical protein